MSIEATRAARRAGLAADLLGLAPVIIFALVLGWIAWTAPHFLRPGNLALILTRSLPTVLVCIGLSAV
jgi:ribose/xylose/arabinose/galactoside ABC-type transport system permease subunit